MIQFTAHMRTLVATEPLDMRKGIDAISAEVSVSLQEDPMRVVPPSCLSVDPARV